MATESLYQQRHENLHNACREAEETLHTLCYQYEAIEKNPIIKKLQDKSTAELLFASLPGWILIIGIYISDLALISDFVSFISNEYAFILKYLFGLILLVAEIKFIQKICNDIKASKGIRRKKKWFSFSFIELIPTLIALIIFAAKAIIKYPNILQNPPILLGYIAIGMAIAFFHIILLIHGKNGGLFEDLMMPTFFLQSTKSLEKVSNKIRHEWQNLRQNLETLTHNYNPIVASTGRPNPNFLTGASPQDKSVFVFKFYQYNFTEPEKDIINKIFGREEIKMHTNDVDDSTQSLPPNAPMPPAPNY